MSESKKKTLWLLAIEPLEERYTAQWLHWWPRELCRAGFNVNVINPPDRLRTKVQTGQFLDAYDTHFYKAQQTREMARAFARNEVTADDVVLLLDGWSPTVTALAYMRDVGNVQCKLVAYMHAGTWDTWDHLYQQGLTHWARSTEYGWLKALELILVGTEFHKQLLATTFHGIEDKVHVVGGPIYSEEFEDKAWPWEKRGRVVVFPHRLAREKAPEEFDQLRAAYEALYPDDHVLWVKTQSVPRSKESYYELLGCARVAVSTARQETWGIGMQEATALGCYPVVPDRLSYRELFATPYRYPDGALDIAARLVREYLDAGRAYDASAAMAMWRDSISMVARLLLE